jgi:hypothetical protein
VGFEEHELHALPKPGFVLGYGLHSLQKNSCFVSGHGFSRAVKATAMRALAPEVLLSCPVQRFLRGLYSLRAAATIERMGTHYERLHNMGILV